MTSIPSSDLARAASRFPQGARVAHRDRTLPEHRRRRYIARHGTVQGLHEGTAGFVIATVRMDDGGTLETLVENIELL